MFHVEQPPRSLHLQPSPKRHHNPKGPVAMARTTSEPPPGPPLRSRNLRERLQPRACRTTDRRSPIHHQGRPGPRATRRQSTDRSSGAVVPRGTTHLRPCHFQLWTTHLRTLRVPCLRLRLGHRTTHWRRESGYPARVALRPPHHGVRGELVENYPQIDKTQRRQAPLPPRPSDPPHPVDGGPPRTTRRCGPGRFRSSPWAPSDRRDARAHRDWRSPR